MVSETLATFGRLDFAFNNAGIGGYSRPIEDIDDADWQRMISVNLTGVFNCIKFELPAMRETGGGVIVNNSSVLGIRALPDTSLEYTAAKHGVIGLTRALAIDLGVHGITVNVICPGPIVTGMTEGIPDDMRDTFARRRTALRRYGEPEEVAHMTLSLALPAASFITGAVIPVDGGLTAKND